MKSFISIYFNKHLKISLKYYVLLFHLKPIKNYLRRRKRKGKIYLKSDLPSFHKYFPINFTMNAFTSLYLYFKNCDLSYFTIIFNYLVVLAIYSPTYATISRILVRFIHVKNIFESYLVAGLNSLLPAANILAPSPLLFDGFPRPGVCCLLSRSRASVTNFTKI